MENMIKFDSIAHLFGSYYYQSVWDYYNTDEDIWKEYIANNSKEVINKLINEIDFFLLHDEKYIMNEVNKYTNMSGTSFDDFETTKTFFIKLKEYLQKHDK
jgi:hypothetical protein